MKIIVFFSIAVFFAMQISGCTPVLVGAAAGGGAYVGYKLHEAGYRIHLTKEVKGTKQKDEKKDNSTQVHE